MGLALFDSGAITAVENSKQQMHRNCIQVYVVRKAWIALRLRNPGIAQVACAWAVFFMSRGMCQLTTNDRSIMVDEVAFDDFITVRTISWKRGRMGAK